MPGDRQTYRHFYYKEKMHELWKLAQLEFTILAKLFWKLAKLQFKGVLEKTIDVISIILLGTNFPTPMASWLQLRNKGR